MTIDLSTLTLVFGLVVQTGGLFYWAGKVNKSIQTMEAGFAKQDERIRRLELGQYN